MNLAEISAYCIEHGIDLAVRKYSYETNFTIVLRKEHEGTSIEIRIHDVSIEAGIMDAMSRLRRMIEKGNPEMLPPQLTYSPPHDDDVDNFGPL